MESTASRFYQRGEQAHVEQFPAISVVVPSFNQVDFLEETLVSLLSQKYPRLEVLVVDGGSQDGSVDVIRRFEHGLSFWCSEPDGGQAQAVRKGFERATGEVLGFLNSDDVLLPGALFEVGSVFSASSETEWISGGCLRFASTDACGPMLPSAPKSRWRWVATCPLAQPSTFWRRSLYDRLGPYPVECRYSHDWHFWLQLVFGGAKCRWTDRVLSGFRVHETSATESQQAEIRIENRALRDRYFPMLHPHEHLLAACEIRRLEAGGLALESCRLARQGSLREGQAMLRKAFGVHPGVVFGAAFRVALRELRKRRG